MMIWANQIFGYHLFGKVRKNLFGGPLGKMGLEQLFGAPRGAYSLAVERTVTKVQTQYIVYRVLNLWR